MPKHMTIINLACTITKLRKWGQAWKYSAESAQNAASQLTAEHERKLTEHRAAFGARTEADAKIIEGLRADVDDLRNRMNSLGLQAAKQANIALGMVEGEGLLGAAQRVVNERDALRAEIADLRGIFDMVHASLGIKCGDHIGKAIEALKQRSVTTPKRTHPVAVGEYLRRLTGFSTTPAGEVAQVLHVDSPTTEYTVKRPNGQQGVWLESGCEPCDPPEATHAEPDLTQLHAKGKEAWSDVPNATQWVEEMRGNTEATHDTEAGKAAAAAAVKTEPVADDIKVGDVVRPKVWGIGQMTKVTQVSPDGTLLIENSIKTWKVDEVVKLVRKVTT